jgi:hypothetical protein
MQLTQRYQAFMPIIVESPKGKLLRLQVLYRGFCFRNCLRAESADANEIQAGGAAAVCPILTPRSSVRPARVRAFL